MSFISDLLERFMAPARYSSEDSVDDEKSFLERIFSKDEKMLSPAVELGRKEPKDLPEPTPTTLVEKKPEEEIMKRAVRKASGMGEPDLEEIERKIRSGLIEYAGGREPPVSQYVPMFMEAIEKYPIFRKHPYLLPQIAILETSAGKDITRENNPLNWAARIQKAGIYRPKTPEQAITDMVTAVGGDVEARPPSMPSRHRQTKYYAPFRESGDLRIFAETYEPENKDYYRGLVEGIKVFERQK